MNTLKKQNWSLATLTNVERIGVSKIKNIHNLHGRALYVFPDATKYLGAGMKDGSKITTHNTFPMIGISGIIRGMTIDKENVSFHYLDIHGKEQVYTPNPTEIVFIMEQDAPEKNTLAPEYAWIPRAGPLRLEFYTGELDVSGSFCFCFICEYKNKHDFVYFRCSVKQNWLLGSDFFVFWAVWSILEL